MRYLLDTTTLIDYSKKDNLVISSLISLIENGDELGICAVNITEFYSGLSHDTYAIWDDFFATLYYWNISPLAAKRAGQYRYEFARKGKILSTTDTLIAAVARENDAIIITNNIKDFPMKDIKLLSL